MPENSTPEVRVSTVRTEIHGMLGEIELNFKMNQEGLVDWLMEKFGEAWLAGMILKHPTTKPAIKDWLTGKYWEASHDGASDYDAFRTEVLGYFATKVCAQLARAFGSLRGLLVDLRALETFTDDLLRNIHSEDGPPRNELPRSRPAHARINYEKCYEITKLDEQVMLGELLAPLTEAIKKHMEFDATKLLPTITYDANGEFDGVRFGNAWFGRALLSDRGPVVTKAFLDWAQAVAAYQGAPRER